MIQKVVEGLKDLFIFFSSVRMSRKEKEKEKKKSRCSNPTKFIYTSIKRKRIKFTFSLSTIGFV